MDGFIALSRVASAEPPSYGEVGRLGAFRQRGFKLDERETELGKGEAAFERAKGALVAWRMFDLGWLELMGRERAPDVGQVVAVVVPMLGLHWVNLAKVIETYEVDEGGQRRFGFVYATMRQHAERGQERFEVAMDEETNAVRFRIEAVSRPSRWWIWCGFPLVRRLQRRFGADAMAAMRRAVAEEGG